MVREIISLHIGGCGTTTGLACWEQYALEEGISPDSSITEKNRLNENFETFYDETADKSVPRAIFMDTDRDSMDEAMCQKVVSTVDKQSFVVQSIDSDIIIHERSKVMESYLEQIRIQSEKSSSLQGFWLHLGADGTTSRLISKAVLDHFSDNYIKSSKSVCCILPSSINRIDINQCTNALSTWIKAIDASETVMIYQNAAISRNYRHTLCRMNPTMRDLNMMIAQSQAYLTMTMRLYDSGNMFEDMASLTTTLVSYPKINSLDACVGPMTPLWGPTDRLPPCESIKQLPGLTMMEYSAGYKDLKYMATALLYRGHVVPKEVGQTTICNIKRRVRYVDWCPTSFKCSLSYTAPSLPPWSRVQVEQLGVGFISNNTGPGYTLSDLVRRYEATSKNDMQTIDLDIEDCLASAKDTCRDYVELAMGVDYHGAEE